MGSGGVFVAPSGVVVGEAPDRRTLADAVVLIGLSELGFRYVGHAHEKRELYFQRMYGDWIDVVVFNTVGDGSGALRYDRRDFPPTVDSHPLAWTTLGDITDVARQVREWPTS